jgi:hypothetical protein
MSKSGRWAFLAPICPNCGPLADNIPIFDMKNSLYGIQWCIKKKIGPYLYIIDELKPDYYQNLGFSLSAISILHQKSRGARSSELVIVTTDLRIYFIPDEATVVVNCSSMAIKRRTDDYRLGGLIRIFGLLKILSGLWYPGSLPTRTLHSANDPLLPSHQGFHPSTLEPRTGMRSLD